MGRHLYLRIYLGFLLVTLVCLVAAGVVARVGEGPVPPHLHEVVEVFVEGLPEDAEAAEAVLRDRAGRLGVEMALFDSQGEVLTATAEDLPAPRWKRHRDHWLHGPAVAVALRDGRWYVVAFRGHDRPPVRHGVVLLLIALLMALGTYPVARGITRRLEQLRVGVDELGAGDLGARVEVRGRDEVAGLARSFNRAAERIEALVHGQRVMLASASHELRSPLARIRVAVELLHESSADDERERHAAEAIRDIEELDALVGDLLLAGRLEARHQASRDEVVDLPGLVAEEASGVEVSGEGRIPGERRLLGLMVRNLLDNASRHGGGAAQVAVQATDGGVRLEVTDRGPGVAEAERERIFEPFYRAPGHREGDGGVGLGLFLVRRIAELHGGTARCEPGPAGVGTRFVVELAEGGSLTMRRNRGSGGG